MNKATRSYLTKALECRQLGLLAAQWQQKEMSRIPVETLSVYGIEAYTETSCVRGYNEQVKLLEANHGIKFNLDTFHSKNCLNHGLTHSFRSDFSQTFAFFKASNKQRLFLRKRANG